MMMRAYYFLIFFVALAAMSFVPSDGARAQDQDAQLGAGAVDFIIDFSKRSLENLTKDELTDAQLRADFGDLYDEAFDHMQVARFSLGRYNRTATKEQVDEFMRLFREFLVANYALRFRQYGGEIVILETYRTEGANIFIVDSRFRQDGADEFITVGWRVGWVRTQQHYKIYDMTIAGVSLAITLRSEVTSLIKNEGGVDGMLKILREKVADINKRM